MLISMIAAMADNRVIGADNKMPWHLPADLAFFKRNTVKKPVIMGRSTFESIGRPLPNRQNIVLSRTMLEVHPDVLVFESLQLALDSLKNVDEVMIIGGGTIYQQCLPLCKRLYLTHIELSVNGDTHFPDYLTDGEWRKIREEVYKPDAANPYGYRFEVLEREAHI